MDIAEKGIIASAGMLAINLLAQETPGYNEYFEAVSIFKKATEICRIRKEQEEKRRLEQIEKSVEVPKVKIEMGGMKKIRTLKAIEWQNYGTPLRTLPAGWEGNITRHRPGAASALLEDGGEFAICDCFLTDGSVEEVL